MATARRLSRETLAAFGLTDGQTRDGERVVRGCVWYTNFGAYLGTGDLVEGDLVRICRSLGSEEGFVLTDTVIGDPDVPVTPTVLTEHAVLLIRPGKMYWDGRPGEGSGDFRAALSQTLRCSGCDFVDLAELESMMSSAPAAAAT